MIKAGALLYAMFLVVVSTITCSSFILYNYHSNYFITGLLKKEQMIKDIYSGINYAMTENMKYGVPVQIDLFDNEKSKVEVEKTHWGAFNRYRASAEMKHYKVEKMALSGGGLTDQKALYLVETNKALSLCGKTIIKGDCYLPKAGVKRAYVEGKNFYGTKLIQGTKYNSNKKLPEIQLDLIDRNSTFFQTVNPQNDSLVEWDEFFEEDSISNSFALSTTLLYSASVIHVKDQLISGNIILQSDKGIVFESQSKVSSIVVYAPYVHIKEGFSGNLQVFASDSIRLENEVVLSYPSLLGLINKGHNKEGKVWVGEDCKVNGGLFLYKQFLERKTRGLLSVGANSEITGEVYSSDLLELKGSVTGSVYCRNFYLKTASSVYENHLIDATINRVDLPDEYVAPMLTDELKSEQVIQWLN